MAQIAGTGEYVIDRVRQIVRTHVPGANCALLDYGKRVGCGELDDSGKLHELRWLRRELDDEQIAKDAERMARMIADANRQVKTDC
ncbi:hypothetical protein [Sphingomonas fuzhouensis]|uniref:hypothetical protein n=1 Tax=Sphingomonas fuzhouensis TaxID=3106033 RepID=UPI002B002236|nr:hypothetical protein [Sphingomonas sp. SGZ-02]